MEQKHLIDNINEYIPSILNPRMYKKCNGELSQNSTFTRRSLSLKRSKFHIDKRKQVPELISKYKENTQCTQDLNLSFQSSILLEPIEEEESMDLTFIEDFIRNTKRQDNNCNKFNEEVKPSFKFNLSNITSHDNIVSDYTSAIKFSNTNKQLISIGFEVKECDKIDLSTTRSKIKNITLEHKNNNITVNCDIIESSQESKESTHEVESNGSKSVSLSPCSRKRRSSVAVNLEIKKTKLTTEDDTENSKVLILNSNAIKRFSNVTIQPLNYRLVKNPHSKINKIKACVKKETVNSPVKNVKIPPGSGNSKQKLILEYLPNNNNVLKGSNVQKVLNDIKVNLQNNGQEMNRIGAEGIKIERFGRVVIKSKENETPSPKSTKIPGKRNNVESPKLQDIKASKSEAPRAFSPKARAESSRVGSPKTKLETAQFSPTAKSKSNKSATSPSVPYFKIVAGTHFAVDAFSYGDIPNVEHYFLTHFHSDHYSGLKKSFSKLLICSQLTADLCTSRLGVNSKFIQIVKLNETIYVEDVEVTAVDANHCPGAIMLVFTLPNGKTILHTGDFRATPAMESYPVFWNKDVHSIYLDTTYCNPRYDFPTQDQSLEMALNILRQKKISLESAGKKFSSVLIICGTYTIGKEKFFLGMSRRVGCNVWACGAKDAVLQAVQGRSFSLIPRNQCQLHVVPMRDLTHEKLHSYLTSLGDTFSEVVAFKPSGWENGRNSTSRKDNVTIHGIPYSEHSSFSELIRFVKFLKPKQVVPTVDITGGVKAVQKYFPCPLVCKDDVQRQSKVTDYFSIPNRQVPAVT